MAFWLGLVRVLHRGGLLRSMARVLRPVMCRLFPEVPADHPAMGMIILNMAANMLGLGNAATPFGLKAIRELDRLNPVKGQATNSMALFLAINTSGLALLPTGMIAIRASLGSLSPGSIVLTSIVATACSTTVAIFAATMLARLPRFRAEGAGAALVAKPASGALQEATFDSAIKDEQNILADAGMDDSVQNAPVQGRARVVAWLATLAVLTCLVVALYRRAAVPLADGVALGLGGALRDALSQWPLVLLIVGFVLFGVWRRVPIYDEVVEGGKEGFDVALRIIPYMVAILVAVGMLRASGAIDLMVEALGPVTALIGMPAEALPMALLRSLSGSGAYAVSAEIMQANGPDSLVGNIVATMQGSTETTFYVLALYFGAAGVTRSRHTLAACLIADAAGALGAVWACRLLL